MSSTLRVLVRRLCKEAGRKDEPAVATTFAEAKQYVLTHHPEVIIAEQRFGSQSSLEILPLLVEHSPHPSHRIFVLVTESACPSVDAIAAEEEVDLFLRKPFSYEALESGLEKTLVRKLTSNGAIRSIDEGRSSMWKGEFAEARKWFEQAKGQDSRSADPAYWLGSLALAQFDPWKAVDCFRDALYRDPVHYRATVGLFEAYSQLYRWSEAKRVAENLMSSFPIHLDRVESWVKVLVHEKAWASLIELQETLSRYEQHHHQAQLALIAGLMAAARQTSGAESEAAMAIAERLSGSRMGCLVEMATYWLDQKNLGRAREVFDRIPQESRGEVSAQILEMELSTLTLPPKGLFDFLTQKMREGFVHPRVFELLIVKSIELARSPAAVQELVLDAGARFPREKARFEAAADPSHAGRVIGAAERAQLKRAS